MKTIASRLPYNLAMPGIALWLAIGFSLATAARHLETFARAGDCKTNGRAYEFVELRGTGAGDPDRQFLWTSGSVAYFDPSLPGLDLEDRDRSTAFRLEAVE